MLPKTQAEAYESFFESTSQNEVLDQQTTVMIQLAAALVIGCYP